VAIRFADNPNEAKEAAAQMLAMVLDGYKVAKVLVEEKINIDKEFYLAITVDGSAKKPVIIASGQGGMEIEDVPDEYIVKQHIDITMGVYPFQGREISRRLGLVGQVSQAFNHVLFQLYKIFREKDAELVEINPLVVSDGKLIAVDAKVTIKFPDLSQKQG
jgi:succinyl-CoA synthetase beta subunit